MKLIQSDLQEKSDALQEEQTRSKTQYDKNEEMLEILASMESDMETKNTNLLEL